MTIKKRRAFLKTAGLSAIPFIINGKAIKNSTTSSSEKISRDSNKQINFIYDGLAFSPKEYLDKLLEINKNKTISPDFYGNGGATKELEEKMAILTNKEKAIFLPTGTMANQLAIKLLNGQNTKAIVPENSHVFRDEADAAQRVHRIRLIGAGKDKAFFDAEDLKNTISYYNQAEVFKSGLGTIVIESPVRRADGAVVPISVVKEIAEYCQQEGYKLHLDAARLHLAEAFAGINIEEYTSYFDTVYLSLYKYLNASGGAILCGKADLIGQIPHLIKIYGGTVFQSWDQTAMALHYLEGITARFKNMAKQANSLINDLNRLEGIQVEKVSNASNICYLKIGHNIDTKNLASKLRENFNILIGRPDENGRLRMAFNESIMYHDSQYLLSAWKKSISLSLKP